MSNFLLFQTKAKMGIRKKRKLEEIQELQESNAVKKRVEHSLLEAQSSGADSNVFLLDTANATNVERKTILGLFFCGGGPIRQNNINIVKLMLNLLKLNLDLATWLKSYFFTSNYVFTNSHIRLFCRPY
jgi:hypothetical protein